MEKTGHKFAGFKFKTRKENPYFYDDNTGMVFPCPDVMFEILQLYQDYPKGKIIEVLDSKYPKKDILNYLNLIENWTKAHGSFFFKKRDSTVLQEPSEEKIIAHLQIHGFKQMILNVTENCNLRCRYCFFSPEYLYTRTYSKHRMNFSIAKKAVDYYFGWFRKVAERTPSRTPVIAFYGGEPLLELDLIREIIAYVRTNVEFDTFFTITTNAVLITEKIIDYFIENKVSLVVSLDGPRKEHDRLRVTKDGSGTFATVMKNLELLSEKYPHYPYNLIISTYDWGTDLDAVKRFFKEKRDVLPFVARASFVSPYFTDYFARYDKKDRLAFQERLRSLREEYFSEISKDRDRSRIPGYLDTLVGMSCRMVLLRQMIGNNLHLLVPYTGACIPGDKLSVSWDGNFHACEKMNDHFPIGNVDDGLDFAKIAGMILQYRNTILDTCSECPVTRLCKSCYTHYAAEGEFKKERADACKNMVVNAKEELAFTYSILEENPGAFNSMMTDYYKELSWL